MHKKDTHVWDHITKRNEISKSDTRGGNSNLANIDPLKKDKSFLLSEEILVDLKGVDWLDVHKAPLSQWCDKSM